MRRVHVHPRVKVQRGTVMDVVVELFYSERFCLYRNVVAVIGALYVLRLLVCECWKLCSGFCAFFLAPWGISRTNLRKYGQWAVVTGSCAGIGRGYALELARQGLNVVIMSNVEERLQKTAEEIKRYGREVRMITVDFLAGQEVYLKLAEQLQDLDIGILVNNVGMGFPDGPDIFTNIPAKTLRNMVELNCQVMVQMTRMLLPKMLERKRGAIVNISSVSAYRPSAEISVYGASKIFVRYFSDALRKECASKGIFIQTVKPCGVATELFFSPKPTFFIPHPDTFTRAAVATIGIQTTTYGYWPHALQVFIFMRLPEWILDRLAAKATREMKDNIRKMKEN